MFPSHDPLKLDHFKSAPELSKRFIPIYSNKDVIKKLGSGTVLEEKQPYRIGDFTVFPLPVKHDVECYAYLIIHPEIGKLVFCTDAASFPYNISGLDHLLIEANYDELIQQEYMLNNFYSHNNIERLTNSHLSLYQAKEIVKRHNSDKLKTIMLLHLSSRNSNSDYFKEEIQKITGKPVIIANKNIEIEL